MEEAPSQEQLEERARKDKVNFVDGWIVALQQRKDALISEGDDPEKMNQYRALDYCQDILFEYLTFINFDDEVGQE